jgi:hypothetical protein
MSLSIRNVGHDLVTNTMKHVLDTQEGLKTKQIELATHQKYLKYSDLKKDTGVILDLQNNIKQDATTLDIGSINSFEDNQVTARLDLIGNLYHYFVGLFDSRNTADLETLQNNAQGVLQNITSAINDPINGKRLFGGSINHQDSVDLSLLPATNSYNLNDTDIVANPTYYKGDFNKSLDENGIARTQCAGDRLFQNMFKTMNLFIHLDPLNINFTAQEHEIERLKLTTEQDIVSLRKNQAYITGRHNIEASFRQKQYETNVVQSSELQQAPVAETMTEMLELKNQLSAGIGMTREFIKLKEELVRSTAAA